MMQIQIEDEHKTAQQVQTVKLVFTSVQDLLQQRNQQMNTSPTPPPAPNLQPKKVDCSGCGAIYTIAPNERKDCEYCGNTVVYE